jgi:RNA polymerase-binding transcription factor DksA
MQNQEKFKQKLMRMKQATTERISAIDRDIRHEGMTADWSEQATERENDEVLESLGITAEQELVMINSALQRIVTGDYFQCSLCGKDIPAERLELLPFSSHCVICADKLEH